MANEIIRVLQIGMHDKIGGVETFIMNYYRNFSKNVIIYDFVSTFPKLCFEDEIKNLGGKIYHVTSEKKNPIKYFFELRKIIKENNYKIVHINMLSAANVLPIIVAKIERVKHIIIHSHNSNTPTGILRKIMHFINKPILHLGTNYFACSRLAGEWLFGKKFVNTHDLKIINNAIDINKYVYNEEIRNEVRKELNLQEKFIIGHIGRFCYQKNHEFLVDIFYEIQKKQSNAILFLIGEGELEEQIKLKVKKLQIEEKVIFFGITDNVGKYLQAMDVFVLPSRFEGLGIVNIEAQCNGLKVICSDQVASDANVSDDISFISLKDRDIWIKEILNSFYISERKNNIEKIREKGYDIEVEAIKLQEKYIQYNLEEI